MAELIANCPRCEARRITFGVFGSYCIGQSYGWQYHFEAFAVCRACKKATIFKLTQDDLDSQGLLDECKLNIEVLDRVLNDLFRVEGFVNVSDLNAPEPPDHLPPDLADVFREGARCKAIGCYNAAATMFRLCVDLATRRLLPEAEAEVEGLRSRARRDLGLRLPWLFDNGYLPNDLRELSSCIREDGNDGAHAGTLTQADAEDLQDFTFELLERMFTEPERLRLAKERRDKRRSPN